MKLKPLEYNDFEKLLKKYKWSFNDENNKIEKYYPIKKYDNVVKFMSISKDISKKIKHHPKIVITHNYIYVTVNTNDFNKITIQDLKYMILLEKLIKKHKIK